MISLWTAYFFIQDVQGGMKWFWEKYAIKKVIQNISLAKKKKKNIVTIKRCACKCLKIPEVIVKLKSFILDAT